VLAEAGRGGTFAARASCAPDDLRITVKGIGPVRLPVTHAQAKKLCAVARRAPFGHGTDTVRDNAVRDTWAIAKSRVRIDRPWRAVLDATLAKLAGKLGLPPGVRLGAELHKMLVYGPGQFFVTHQDSETSDTMVGTLVVVLPSRYRGGALVVRHNGDKKTFGRTRGADRNASLIAFYSDCRHEVRPVTSGYRVCLTYHLVRRGSATTACAPRESDLVERLVERLARYFETPVEQRYSREEPTPPDRLVYLLDHEYTQRSLGWDRLKGRDIARAGLLTAAAERLDCELHLALADVHEVWSCSEPDPFYGRGWHGRWREYEPVSDDEWELEELVDDDVRLRHWIGADGENLSGPPSFVRDHELCFTRPSVEMEPAESEYEGFMGNYGNTMDRWYQRAALVIWPRSRAFAVRARLSPSWALAEIAGLIKKRQVEAARTRARVLTPFWTAVAPHEKSAKFFAKLVRVARGLDDADLAMSLLAPFHAERLTASSIRAFVPLVDRYGADWGRTLLEKWTGQGAVGRDSWRARLPDLAFALEASDGAAPRELAHWLMEREVADFEGRCAAILKRRAWLDDRCDRLVEEAEPLLRACVASRATASRDRLLRFLCAPESGIPALSLTEILRRLIGRGEHVVALGGLHRHVVERVRSIATAPARDPNDWAIHFATDCSCALCRELAGFLRDSDRDRFDWPLAKEGRKHIHHVLNSHGLPVVHETRRSGRPFTLQLRKQEALFTAEEQRRSRHSEALLWLERDADAFEDD